MMKTKKSFKELAKQISELQENQLGKLKGGFVAFSATLDTVIGSTNDNLNINDYRHCTCSCTCSDTIK